MKTIGLLGGTSWPSTFLYYDYINRKIAQHFGGYHSAEIILYSIDYHEIKSLYNTPDGWKKIPQILLAKYKHLEKMKPDCILICNNTLHRALPEIRAQFDTDIPLIDIVSSTGKQAKTLGLKKLLFTGTQFTMEDTFFTDRLQKEYGLEINIPTQEDRANIQAIQTAVSTGNQTDEHQGQFTEIIKNYPDYDGVILACTELPLVARPDDFDIPLINTIYAQCDEALAFTLD